MANVLDPNNWTEADALRAASEGRPVPDHLKHLFTFSHVGRSKERVSEDLKENRLPNRLKWGKPWYRSGGASTRIAMHGTISSQVPSGIKREKPARRTREV